MLEGHLRLSQGYGWQSWCFRPQPKQSVFTYDAACNTVAIAGTGGTAPAITAPPQTQLLEPNQSVSFSVAATGLGMPISGSATAKRYSVQATRRRIILQ